MVICVVAPLRRPHATLSLPASTAFAQQTCHGAIQFTVYEELKHLAGTLSSTWSSHAVDGPPGQRLAGTSDLAQASLAGSSATNNDASSSTAVQGAAHRPAYRLSSLETSVCAVLSKLSASVITYPSQVVRRVWRGGGRGGQGGSAGAVGTAGEGQKERWLEQGGRTQQNSGREAERACCVCCAQL